MNRDNWQHFPIDPSRLPASWETAYVGDVSTDIQPGFASGEHNQDGRGIPHIRPMNISRLGAIDLGEIKYVAGENPSRLIEGDVLFNNTNSPALVGKTSPIRATENWAFSNHMTRVRLMPGMEYRFIACQLHFLWMAGYFRHRCVNHVNQASISSKTLATSVPLVIPPMNEQRRIVAKIEELFSDLDAGVAALERIRANLKRYRAAVLKAAVEGKLTQAWRAKHPHTEPATKLLERILAERRQKWEENQLAKFAAAGKTPPKGWREKYIEPAAPDTSGLPELPPGWCWSSLGQCFEVHIGSTPSRKEISYWNGKIPWVSSGEVQFCRIKTAREYITEEGLASASTRLNPPGSILLGMIGEGRTRGQAAILDIEACNNQNSAAIWVSKTLVLPEYVYYWLYSQYEATRRSSSGNNQPALNRTRVEQILFPLAPIAEQGQIVSEVERILSVIEGVEVQVSDNLKRASRLRQSILKRAFEGKLVPQDPNDESAEKLLERISSARETASQSARETASGAAENGKRRQRSKKK